MIPLSSAHYCICKSKINLQFVHCHCHFKHLKRELKPVAFYKYEIISK